MEEVLLVAAVLGLLWYSKRNQAPRGDMCNQGACVQPRALELDVLWTVFRFETSGVLLACCLSFFSVGVRVGLFSALRG
jgi:hypothetical protein